jgi:hypothetical protein
MPETNGKMPCSIAQPRWLLRLGLSCSLFKIRSLALWVVPAKAVVGGGEEPRAGSSRVAASGIPGAIDGRDEILSTPVRVGRHQMQISGIRPVSIFARRMRIDPDQWAWGS